MVLSLFALVLVLGITFMHSIFGLFSGLIDLMCCLTALVVTFGFFESLTDLVTRQELHPSYTLPVCFIGLFFVTHLTLRLLADNLIRGNVRVPMYVDWAGGAFCGFVIAQVTVGVLVLGFLMLPWGGRVMMYSREQRMEELNAAKRVDFKHNTVAFFLRPDEFAVGLFNLLSEGSLRGNQTLASVYPDFPQWVFWTGNTVQGESATAPFRDKQGDGWGEGGLSVVSWWEEKAPVQVIYRWKLPSKLQELDDLTAEKVWPRITYPDRGSGTHLLGVRLRLPPASADRDKNSSFHRFRPSMLRLVGDVGSESRQYCARVLGGAHPGTEELRLVDIDNNFAIPASGDIEVDAYFEVPETLQPRFVEYRRFARAPLPAAKRVAAAPDERLIAPVAGGGEARMVGAMRFIGALIRESTGDRTDLPFPLSPAALQSSGEVELASGRFKSGRIHGTREQLQGAGPVGSVREFAVPEGRRLFQLCCNPRKALTLAGNVFNFVGSVANTYQARDDASGEEFALSGYYAIVKRDGKDYIEIYIPNEVEAPAFRGLLDFKFIDRQELRREDSVLGLLFFAKPGARITSVTNQNGQGVEFPSPGFELGK